MMTRRAGGAVAALVLTACGRAATQNPPGRPADTATVPVGYGTLRRDDIAVRFTTGQLEIQVLPIGEPIIRLLAPDTYRSLTQLVQSQHVALERAARSANLLSPTLVMVTFFGIAPQARFVPDDLNLTSRGRLFRPVAIVPLSPSWSAQQLEVRQQAVAIYLFEDGIAFREALTVTYQRLTSDAWAASARLLEREYARVLSRASQAGTPPPDR